MDYHSEQFDREEAELLTRFFSNIDSPVFVLINLPDVVKGALFARYSRSSKSLRRLFLDEYINDPELGIKAISEQIQNTNPVVRIQRAEQLYEKVFNQYGDDSIAQLGGAHIACEQSSNLLTKVLERGRLGSYLEQSTRYIYYDQRLGDKFRFFVPDEIRGSTSELPYIETMEWLFEQYSQLIPLMERYFEQRFPKTPNDSNFVYRSTIRAKACDTLRGLLPAATQSNVGIFATGQAYEMLLLRMRAHPLSEVRDYSDMMLKELRSAIPAFLKRVDQPSRGVIWSDYLSNIGAKMTELGDSIGETPDPRPEVQLVEWDAEAETKIIAAALYEYTEFPDSQLLEFARGLSCSDRNSFFETFVGDRYNRRHKPGRGLERVGYRFDLLTDFGVFRDLQRHRMLTIQWQVLTPNYGYVTPELLIDAGASSIWHLAMSKTSALYEQILVEHGRLVAQYVVPFAYRIRYAIQLNVREAFHVLELRTAQGGHQDYRRVCQKMHHLIREKAEHRLIANAMKYVDYKNYDLERLGSERRSAKKRANSGISDPLL